MKLAFVFLRNTAILLFILYLKNAYVVGEEMKQLKYMNLLRKKGKKIQTQTFCLLP